MFFLSILMYGEVVILIKQNPILHNINYGSKRYI